MLLRSVPMRSGSQQCVKVVQGTRSFTAISTGQNRIGRRDSVHVLVHVRLRHYCLLLQHPTKLYWRTGLSFCERYAKPCVDVRLAATFQDLDSKSADPCGHGGSTPPPGTSLINHLFTISYGGQSPAQQRYLLRLQGRFQGTSSDKTRISLMLSHLNGFHWA